MQEQVLQSLATIINILWPVILIVVLVFITATTWFKELVNKFYIYVLAKRRLKRDGYHVIYNVALPTENGNIEIDHIIVSIHGVIVVETMKLRGRISGTVHHRIWTQIIDRKAFKFPNPVHHNDLYTQSMSKMLNLSEHQFFTLVVFTGNCTFKNEVPENVILSRDYLRWIKSKDRQVLVEPQVLSIVEDIESGSLVESYKTHWQEVREIREDDPEEPGSDPKNRGPFMR